MEAFKKELIRSEKESREAGERHEEIASKQIRLLESNKKKGFYLSEEFQKAALEEFRKTFQFQKERGMIVIFKEQDGAFYGSEFYGSDWIIRNQYGDSTPLSIWVKENSKENTPTVPVILGSFWFDNEKIAKLGEEKGSIAINCHTHPTLARPSPGDLRHSFWGIVIGFERINDTLKELLRVTFYKHPEEQRKIARKEDFERPEGIMSDKKWTDLLRVKVGQEVIIRKPHVLPEELYDKVVKECNPGMRLFYAKQGEKLNEIPLLVRRLE